MTTKWNAAVRAAIEKTDLTVSPVGVWVYGSGAWSSTAPARDVDALIVSAEARRARRILSEVNNGPAVSLNVIGPNSLSAHNEGHNGGFYFTGKFLSPLKLIEGDEVVCRALVAGAIAHMIYPWAMYLLDESAEGELFTVEQLVSLLYLLMIRINFNYLNYFAKWRISPEFSEFRLSVCDFVKETLTQLRQSNGVEVESNRGVLFRIKPDFPSKEKRRILLEFLKSSHWQSFFSFRRSEANALEAYYQRQVRNAGELGTKVAQESLDFLYETVGPRFLASFIR